MTLSRARRGESPDAARRLLITGFGAFDGGPNCSELLVRRLERDHPQLEARFGGAVAFATLAVRADTIEAELGAALRSARPTHVLMTGQAAGRTALCFEQIARNRLHIGVPDALGRVGEAGVIRPAGPETRAATWPDLARIAAAISGEGAPARLSDDAGTHLCNLSLYLALEAAETADPRFVATFLHLPLLPEQVAADVPAARRHAGCFALPLDDMARAVERILVHTRVAA